MSRSVDDARSISATLAEDHRDLLWLGAGRVMGLRPAVATGVPAEARPTAADSGGTADRRRAEREPLDGGGGISADVAEETRALTVQVSGKGAFELQTLAQRLGRWFRERP